MLPFVVACFASLLLRLGQAQVATQTQGQSQSVGQDSSATPWRQVIQWENNGRVFSLLNSGAEYVPAGAVSQDRAPRVVVEDTRATSPRRPQGGNVRRQAPPRGSSETVRGQARHPFGFGQVPDNWRQTAGGTGGTQFQGSTGARFRPSTGSSASSSSSSSSSFSSSSYNVPSYPQYPFPQQPPQAPFQPYDSGFVEGPVRSYEPPFQPVPGGGYGGGGYTAGRGYVVGGYGGGVAPMLPGSPSDFTDDGYRYYQSYGYGPNPLVPARAAQPPFTDGLDHRYTHSLFNEDPAAPASRSSQGAPVIMDRPGPVSQGTAGQGQVRSPQYEQFPPFGRPQPPFLQPIPQGRNSPNSALEIPNVGVGSVFRAEQRGTVRLLFWFVN